ncbi:MAG: branched-chain amino acid ABC transporter permease [Bacillota bacterium]
MGYLNSILILGGINVLAVVGVAVLTGYTGLFTIGHAAFMAIGGYTAAVLVVKLGQPFWLALVAAGSVAAVSSLIVGYPSLRSKLKGDYFAIAMLGFGEAVRLLLNNTYKVINGAIGFTGIPLLTTSTLVVVLDIVGIILVRNFVISQYGKNCVAIREQEVAAELMGIDVLKTKLWALGISAFYGGVAGGLFGFYMTYLAPGMFTSQKSSDLLAGVVFGGMSSITGPVLAAFLLVVLPELLRFLFVWRLVIYGLLFVIIMVFRPQGLLGYRDINWASLRRLWARFSGGRRPPQAVPREGGR